VSGEQSFDGPNDGVENHVNTISRRDKDYLVELCA
jgi:hypothetical protein